MEMGYFHTELVERIAMTVLHDPAALIQKNLGEWGSEVDLFGCTILQPMAVLSRNGLFESGSGGLLSPMASINLSRYAILPLANHFSRGGKPYGICSND